MATKKRPSLSPPPSSNPSPSLSSLPLPSTSLTTPSSPFPTNVDYNLSPFTLTSPSHNLLLTLLTQSHNQPHPWIKCHKCGKWRKLPPTLSGLSPLLPSLPLTLHSLSTLSSPFLPFPFTCPSNPWDIDRQVCGAIQDYQDLVYEWKQVPLRFVRAVPRFDFYLALAHFLRTKGVTLTEYPCVYGKSVDLFALYTAVQQLGGDDRVTREGWWAEVYRGLKLPVREGEDVEYLMEIYRSYFFEWEKRGMVEIEGSDVVGESKEGVKGEKMERRPTERGGGESEERKEGDVGEEGEEGRKRMRVEPADVNEAENVVNERNSNGSTLVEEEKTVDNTSG